jgi:integrase
VIVIKIALGEHCRSFGTNERKRAVPHCLAKPQRGVRTVPRLLFRAMVPLPERERLMGMICATTGLRIGEALGLKWEDIDFTTHMAEVLRSYSDGAIGPCKTEISEHLYRWMRLFWGGTGMAPGLRVSRAGRLGLCQ